MERDLAAALAMGDLDPKTEQVAQLPLERLKIGVDRAPRRALGGAADVVARSRPNLFRQMLGLPDREVALHDLVGQIFRVGGGCNGPRMPHADIASQEH